MATAYITEVTSIARDIGGGTAPIIVLNGDETMQTVTFTTTTPSLAFQSDTRIIRVQTDAAAHILIGANPTATTSHHPINANQEYHFAVEGGDRIALVAAT